MTAIPAALATGRKLLCEAHHEMVEGREGHEHAVERESAKGLHLHLRVPVPAHADVPDLPLLPRLDGRLQRPAGSRQLVQLLHAPDVVHSPFVTWSVWSRVRLSSSWPVLPPCAAAGLGGDPHFVPPMLGHLAYPHLRLSLGIYPGRVKVADPMIQGVADHPNGFRSEHWWPSTIRCAPKLRMEKRSPVLPNVSFPSVPTPSRLSRDDARAQESPSTKKICPVM